MHDGGHGAVSRIARTTPAALGTTGKTVEKLIWVMGGRLLSEFIKSPRLLARFSWEAAEYHSEAGLRMLHSHPESPSSRPSDDSLAKDSSLCQLDSAPTRRASFTQPTPNRHIRSAQSRTRRHHHL